MRDLATLTLDDFRGLVGERFALREPPGFRLELTEVTEIPREPGGRAPFSLVFSAAQGARLPQGTYRLEHHRFGALEIFLVPIGPWRYEAVFS